MARKGITLQKMEMPKQTGHRKPKVLQMPSEVCAVLITFEILSFIKFYKNAEFHFTFFLSYVVSTQHTSWWFFGEGEYAINRMSPKLD
uniref:Uncharacterized protein n=1 Tax=Saimiri boliviensis boliviensis TaxID=39432 RepID=A0A2K6T617_SAIBB